MASGYVTTLLNTLPDAVKRVLIPAFDFVQENWHLGTGSRAVNAQWYRFTSTTATVANTEFSVLHGLNQIPNQLFPVLDLQSTGSQMVPLTVTRKADGARIYLASSSTNAVFSFFTEL